MAAGDTFSYTCTAAATGTAPDSFEWKKGATAGVTTAAYSGTAAASHTGSYTCIAKKGSMSSPASDALALTVDGQYTMLFPLILCSEY